MTAKYSGIDGYVGNTPLIRLRRLSELTGCEILGKAEFMNPAGSVKDRLNHYFNDAAFSRPAPDTFGTMPRTLSNYRSPGIRNADAAVFKNVNLTEAKYFQLRLEAYNVTNTPTFATPHMTYGASNFGVIDAYAGSRGPREMQVVAWPRAMSARGRPSERWSGRDARCAPQRASSSRRADLPRNDG